MRLLFAAAKTFAWLFSIGLAAQCTPAAVHYERLKSFGYGNRGFSPQAPVILGSDGMFYGTSYFGGPPSLSTVFRLNKDGSGYTVLHRFITESDGQNPLSALLEGSDGVLYGTMSRGGAYDEGTLFRVNKDGSGFSVLHSFSGEGEGHRPIAALVEAHDGTLYGTAQFGSDGTVFKLNKDGSAYSTLYTFTVSNYDTDGAAPEQLLVGSDGGLYGTTSGGGGNGAGTAFKLNTDGTGYSVLVSLTNTFMSSMFSALSEGSDGMLYGTTDSGGNNGVGTVFKLNKNGSDYRVLHSFEDGSALYPNAPVLEGSDGALYGTTAEGGRDGRCLN